MNTLMPSFAKPCAGVLLVALALGGCATRPASSPAPAAQPAAPAPGTQRHLVDVGPGITVDYQIERKLSALNATSCFAFISGSLVNDSQEVLSRRTVLDFNVFSGGQQVFRDLTSPVTDVAPGRRVAFGMVVSPVHRDGCVAYDRIVVSLRKVVAP